MPPNESNRPIDPAPSRPTPGHERIAAEEAATVNWEAIAANPRFRELLRAKRRFIIPAMIIFIVYYFALPVLVGYARPLMESRLFGTVNLAYLFALSQFFMAWIIAAFYVRAANRFDRQAREIISDETSRRNK